jgi:type IV secretion system protein VirD4
MNGINAVTRIAKNAAGKASLAKKLLPCLPYALIFWAANRLSESIRAAPGDIVRRVVQGTARIGSANPIPSLHPGDVLVGALAAGLLYAYLAYKKKKNKNRRPEKEFGSARWGTKKDIAPYIDPKPENNVILTATESLTMNSRPKSPKTARNKNICVIGGSGSGKTRYFVKPNLMQCDSEDYPVSFVVTDPKGTLVEECGGMLRKKGYKIKVLNTINFKASMKYNPFDYIRSEKDILKLVKAFIANTDTGGKKGEDFWEKAETNLYTALIGFIWYEGLPEEKNMNMLLSLLNEMEAREEDESYKNPVDLLFDALEQENGEHFAVRQYKKYKQAAGKTAKSILISCGARLAPFDIKEVRDLMSEDELELDKIGGYKKKDPKTGKETIVKQKTALFVIISDTDDTFNFIAGIMYSQLFNILCDVADIEHRGRLPVHVRCILDEFANIGQIPKFEKLIATIRSREISACIILQTQSQLKAIYKDNAETIMGNCSATLFLGGQEQTTLKEMSAMLGKETIEYFSGNRTTGNSPSHTRNQQLTGRELMTADELLTMDGGKCLLQIQGIRPFFSDKYEITKHPNYEYLSDADEKNFFDAEAYITRKYDIAKENANTTCETYTVNV